MAASVEPVLSLCCSSSFVLLLLFLCASNSIGDDYPLKACKFEAIYQLGDSISDTGNLIRENPTIPFSRFPYGQSFFKNATGRCSNGLLIIDYFALASGLPFVNPYLNKEVSLIHGANFAVAGATALPTEVLDQKNIFSPITNTSLDKQLHWMSTHFNTTYSNRRGSIKKLKNALFFVGEIGGNDYNYALLGGKTIAEVRNMVPEVVQIIKAAVQRVISYGAVQVIVPGYFSIGCLPIYLSRFQINNSAAYDKFRCLKDPNNIARYHNNHLKQALKTLRKENPHVIIAYGDYYNALQWVLQRASLLGFDVTSMHKSCCGIGGDYDFNIMQMCGLPGVPICPNPNERIHWDGIHLTQKTYQHMAYWLIHDLSPKLHCMF